MDGRATIDFQPLGRYFSPRAFGPWAEISTRGLKIYCCPPAHTAIIFSYKRLYKSNLDFLIIFINLLDFWHKISYSIFTSFFSNIHCRAEMGISARVFSALARWEYSLSGQKWVFLPAQKIFRGFSRIFFWKSA